MFTCLCYTGCRFLGLSLGFCNLLTLNLAPRARAFLPHGTCSRLSVVGREKGLKRYPPPVTNHRVHLPHGAPTTRCTYHTVHLPHSTPTMQCTYHAVHLPQGNHHTMHLAYSEPPCAVSWAQQCGPSKRSNKSGFRKYSVQIVTIHYVSSHYWQTHPKCWFSLVTKL